MPISSWGKSLWEELNVPAVTPSRHPNWARCVRKATGDCQLETAHVQILSQLWVGFHQFNRYSQNWWSEKWDVDKETLPVVSICPCRVPSICQNLLARRTHNRTKLHAFLRQSSPPLLAGLFHMRLRDHDRFISGEESFKTTFLKSHLRPGKVWVCVWARGTH